MANNLTSVNRVKRQLEIGQNGTANYYDDDLIADYVSQASSAIETYTKRSFCASQETLFWDSMYPTVEGRKLYFDQDVLGIDAVSNGANGTINAANWRLLPNHFSPKYGLELLTQSGLTWQVGNDGGAQNAICTIGTFGFCVAGQQPTDVTLAATKLAAFLYQNRDNDGSIVEMADGAKSIPAEAPQMVFKLLEKYVRKVSYQ